MSSSQPVLHGKTLPQKEEKEGKKNPNTSLRKATIAFNSQTLGSLLVWKEILTLREGIWETPGQSQQNTDEGVSAQRASAGSQWASSD